MSTIKLYWCPKTRAMRALWLMEESGMPYERVHIDIRDKASRAHPGFSAASPMGKVPALEDGAVCINDSGAICAYIADKYPQAKLAPTIDDPLRGKYLQWLMFTNSNIEPAMIEKFQNIKPNPSTHGWGSWDAMLTTFRNGVEKGPWILGERFSAADVMLGSAAHFLFMFKMIEPAAEPALDAYAKRCIARPAAQRALALEA